MVSKQHLRDIERPRAERAEPNPGTWGGPGDHTHSYVSIYFRILQSLVKSIRDLLFSHGPSVSRQQYLPRKQALAQQPANELNPEMIIEFSRWSNTISRSNSNYSKFMGCGG